MRISHSRNTLPSTERRRGMPLVRAAASKLISYVHKNSSAEGVLRQHWPHDRETELVLKAATDPASISGSGWADTLASSAVADFLLGMGPPIAGSALLERGLQLEFNGSAAILCPGALGAAMNANFVQDGQPIRVREFSIDGPTLTPRKFATIATFTREAFSHSTPTIEALVSAVLSESVGLALDAALLDDSPGDATRPAGLRNGISPLTASTTTPPSEALAEDLAS